MRYNILIGLVICVFGAAVSGRAQSNVDFGAVRSPSELAISHGTSGGDHLFIAVKTDGNKAGHYISTDNGRSWSGSDTTPGFHPNDNDAWGALDTRRGYAYESCYTYVMRSDDWGATWSHTTAYDSRGGCDKPCIAVDNTDGVYTHSVYLAFGGSQTNGYPAIWLQRSTDGGSTFLPRIDIAPARDTACGLPTVVVDGTGAVYVFYVESIDAMRGVVVMKRSTDGGRSFQGDPATGQPIFISECQLTNHMSYAAAASRTSGSCVVVCEPPLSGSKVGDRSFDSLLVAVSSDGGDTFFTMSGVAAGTAPTLASAAISDSGAIFIGFYASSRGNHHCDRMMVTVSSDFGFTWHLKVISSAPCDLHWQPDSAPPYDQLSAYGTGDYFGMTPIADPWSVGMAWADNRTGAFRGYYQSVSMQSLVSVAPPASPRHSDLLDLRVHPIPANGTLSIEMVIPADDAAHAVNITVINTAGEIVRETTAMNGAGPATKTLALAGLPSGTYTLSVHTAHHTSTASFVVGH